MNLWPPNPHARPGQARSQPRRKVHRHHHTSQPLPPPPRPLWRPAPPLPHRRLPLHRCRPARELRKPRLSPSRLSSYSFSRAVMMLCPQAEDLVRRHRPDAIISDVNLPWTAQVARKYDIPRIIFHGTCLFSLCVSDSVTRYRPYEGIDSDYELFLVPVLPEKVPIARSWMPSRFFRRLGLQDFSADFAEAERNTYGVVANTLFEIEPQYVDHYGKITGKKVWPVGPVSLCNEEGLTMADRGNRTSIEKGQCLSWLNSKEPNSVIYVCFGSLCVFAESQLVEIGLGLEASMCNFIWVVRDGTGDGVALGDLRRE
ncbi:unnamed protein product [Thlaspi arvense]|uniref:Uncharacterized protein n=1 Tax=Thlaspi arvense TaxID=13288 RepID=A0AAU9RKM2_THLAR|nr:unnamed protein product [Thlaspi arvense]